jgi:four helix bundle protein
LVGYEKLNVWQESMDLVTEIYTIIKRLPKEELYSLSDQIRRSAVSIPSNIAEGSSRNSKKEFIQFLYIALGSLCELETQLKICINIGYLQNMEHIFY